MRYFYLIIFVIVSVLAGCEQDFSPLVAVEVTDQGLTTALPHTRTWRLNQVQLKALERWLYEHNSEVGVLLVSPPSPSQVILLTHANGSRSSLDLFSADKGWEHIVIISSSGKSRVKNITPAERETLFQLLKEMPA